MAHIRKLKSGLWQATVRHPSGQRFSKSDPLKRVVKEWADESEAKLRRGDIIDPNAGKITLTEWWDKWTLTRRVEAATRDRDGSQWRNHIQPKFGTWPLVAIHSWDVEAWVSDLAARGVGAVTVRDSLRLLTTALNQAIRHRLLSVNPAALVKAPKPPKHVDRVLSSAEADHLLNQFTGQDRLFVQLLLCTGLRWQEAASLRAFRVDLLRKRLQVAKVYDRRGNWKPPKTEAGVRLVPLTASLVEGLSRQITAPGEALVFTAPQGGQMSYTTWLRRVWRPAVRAAKLADPQPTPHDCRHTYGSWLADDNVPLHEIAARMGHASLQSVQRYVHASDDRMDRVLEALEERGRRTLNN